MTAETPNFGALLAPVLGQVDAGSRPRFLALLERSAADRYRNWAGLVPEHHEILLACAGREDEIADRVEAAFAIDEERLSFLHALLPEARRIYLAAFEGLAVLDQIRMQADAELQGAHAWRSIAKLVTDPEVLATLATCSELEEFSSSEVRSFL